jgi:hypothetical protein
VKSMVRTVAAIVLGMIVALHAATTAFASFGGLVTGVASTVDVSYMSDPDQTHRAELTAAQEDVGGEDQTSRDGSSCQDHCGWHIVAAADPKFPATDMMVKHIAVRLSPPGNLVSVPPPQ